jgi:hypothetical protein
MHRAALLKGGVRDGTYKFLVSMLSFEFLYGTTLLDMQQTRSLTLSGDMEAAEHKLHVPKDSIRHEGFPVEPVLPVAGLLFTGNLKVCAIEKAEGQATRPALPPTAVAAG